MVVRSGLCNGTRSNNTLRRAESLVSAVRFLLSHTKNHIKSSGARLDAVLRAGSPVLGPFLG